MAIIAYEMVYTKEHTEAPQINCVPFREDCFWEYMQIYNACFYEMRKALDIKPYNYLSDYRQIREKREGIFLLMEANKIIGSVACLGNEIDDLIVDNQYQGRGLGRQLLLWGINHIRRSSQENITLHVAECNERAIRLYRDVGFDIVNIEKIR